MNRLAHPESRLSGRGDGFLNGLIVVSNREPYCHQRKGGKLKLEVPAGGLVSALDTVLRVTGGTWIAWGSGNGDREGSDENGRLWVPPARPSYILKRVWLSSKAVQDYYLGFCNHVLWPLLHGEPERVLMRRRFWPEYEKTNRLFADAVLKENEGGATVWLHDYHLCLVPSMLRTHCPEGTIAHFWHVPWPEPDIFIRVPHCEDLLAGLLANDLIGFQLASYADNFLRCTEQCLGASVDRDAMTVIWRGRLVQVRSFPISVDFTHFDRLAGSEVTAARIQGFRMKHRLPRHVGLGVDRLDYTKGIAERLRALELFFRRYPEFKGLFTFVQFAVMTRSGKSYREYRKEVEDLVRRINAEHATNEWQPVLFFMRRLEPEDLVAWYRLADLAVITPVRDGMNLVAKEYVASRGAGEGVLILGRGAGAAAELAESIIVDPHDTEAFAVAIRQALTMPRREKQERMARLRERVEKNTVYHWVGNILDELALLPVTKRGGRHALRHWDEIAARLAGNGLFICLDFDGTLAPIVEQPEVAAMPDGIRSILMELMKLHPVAVISGRSLADIRKRVDLPGVVCLGSHGAEMEGRTPYANGRTSLDEFLSAASRSFASIPGVLIEDKGVTASIHFRRVAPLLLGDFFVEIKGIAGEFAEKVNVTEGRKVFEIRPRGAAGKGDALRQLMEGAGKGRATIYMGDDTGDEEAFRALRGAGISVAVGGSPEADYYLTNQGEVGEFLELLAQVNLPCEEDRSGTDDVKGTSK